MQSICSITSAQSSQHLRYVIRALLLPSINHMSWLLQQKSLCPGFVVYHLLRSEGIVKMLLNLHILIHDLQVQVLIL